MAQPRFGDDVADGPSAIVFGAGFLVAGTAQAVFVYDKPVVTSVQPQNMPIAGGSEILITGFNFGVTDPTAEVRLGASLCDKTKWFSDNTIRCLGVPPFEPKLPFGHVLSLFADAPSVCPLVQ